MNWAERQVRRADRFQQRHAVLAFPFAVMQKFGNDQASGKAALMAYYGLFALFPLLLLLATTLGYILPSHPALREQLINSALGYFPVIGEQLRSEIHPLEGNPVALAVGIVGSVYGSFGIGLSAQNAMNTIWNIPYVRWPGLFPRYLRALAVIALLGLAVVASTALAVFGAVVASRTEASLLAVAASALLNFGIFVLAFMVLTAEPLPPHAVALGAAVAALFWEALQLIGTWYVARGLKHASPTYGFFAVVITLLGWMFLSAQSTLLAAEINVVRRYRLWPRSVTQPPLIRGDRLVLQRLAIMEVRRPEERVAASFTAAADHDPLEAGRSVPDGRSSGPAQA